MNKNAKLIYDILSGTKDSNIIFNDLLKLLRALGFQERVKGDHFIFYRSDIEEIINIQPKGNKAKLPGCMADGKTRIEVLHNTERVIEEWIETAKSLGRPIPKPKGKLAYA